MSVSESAESEENKKEHSRTQEDIQRNQSAQSAHWKQYDINNLKSDNAQTLILLEIQDLKKDLKEDIDLVSNKVESINRRLFIGNGQKSLVERINKNTMITKVTVWCIGVLYVGIVTGCVAYIFNRLGGG